MDIALDPHFAQNGFIYAFEVIDPSDAAGKTGKAGLDGSGNRYAQVIRYTADPATNFSTILPNSAKILLGNAGQSEADISGGGAQDFTDPAFSARSVRSSSSIPMPPRRPRSSTVSSRTISRTIPPRMPAAILISARMANCMSPWARAPRSTTPTRIR